MEIINWDRPIETIDGQPVELIRVVDNEIFSPYTNLVREVNTGVTYQTNEYGNKITADIGDIPFIRNVPVVLQLYGRTNEHLWTTFKAGCDTLSIELTQKDLDRLMRLI